MRAVVLLVLLALALPATALARFGLIIPSDELVTQGEPSAITLRLGLGDPQAPFLELARPKRFGVQHLGEETDLLATLKPAQDKNPLAWFADFASKRPGDYTFYVEHPPRWEAADEQFIVHLAKVCVNALALEEGWDEPVGLEAEIIPLSRPYGLWTGNLFSGQVLLNGEPAPYAAIEIAWFGTGLETSPATPVLAPAYRLHKLRADANGVFHYAMPRAGWWGFAAILDADWTIRKDSDEKPVSLVSSYWVTVRDPR